MFLKRTICFEIIIASGGEIENGKYNSEDK